MESVQIQKDLIEKVNFLLESRDDDYITPTFLEKHHKGLYRRLKLHYSDQNGKIDWYAICQRINPSFMKKIKYNRTKHSAMMELNDLLNNEKPVKINSRYLKKLNSELYDFLRQNFRDAKGFIDWKFVISHWDVEHRDRFEYPIRFQRSLPQTVYESEFEVQEKMRVDGCYRYTFFQAKHEDEFEKRNALCLALVDLAKKGNTAAEKELLNLMYFLLEKWIENIPAFNAFKFHVDDAREIVRRCIYNYRPIGPFVGYIHESMKRAALGLEKMQFVQYDDAKRYVN